MGKSSSPPPDYVGAAQATAQGNLEQAQVAAAANRVNQITPQGSLTYSQADPSDPNSQWTATQTYSPAQQQLFDQSNQLSTGLLGLAGDTLGQIGANMSTPTTAADLPANMVNAGETGQQAYMRMAQPDLDMQREQAESQAANQGITQGSQAWQNLQRQLGVNQNNAENQAITSGFGMGQQAQQQALQIDTALKAQPINMIDALRTGSQVSNPQFASVPQQATVAGPDALGAANLTGNYQTAMNNANNASANSATSAAASLAAAEGASYAYTGSLFF